MTSAAACCNTSREEGLGTAPPRKVRKVHLRSHSSTNSGLIGGPVAPWGRASPSATLPGFIVTPITSHACRFWQVSLTINGSLAPQEVSMSKVLKGVYSAVATPFTQDQQIDEAGLRRLVDRTIESGIHGL